MNSRKPLLYDILGNPVHPDKRPERTTTHDPRALAVADPTTCAIATVLIDACVFSRQIATVVEANVHIIRDTLHELGRIFHGSVYSTDQRRFERKMAHAVHRVHFLTVAEVLHLQRLKGRERQEAIITSTHARNSIPTQVEYERFMRLVQSSTDKPIHA